MAAHFDWALDVKKERLKRRSEEWGGQGKYRREGWRTQTHTHTHTRVQIPTFACITSESLSSAAPQF